MNEFKQLQILHEALTCTRLMRLLF